MPEPAAERSPDDPDNPDNPDNPDDPAVHARELDLPARESAKPLLEQRAGEDREEGWGDQPSAGFSDDWYLSERPPHHG